MARINECGHPEQGHKALGMCGPCYQRQPRFVAARRAYVLTTNGKAVRQAAQAAYRDSDKGRERRKEYYQTAEAVSLRRAASLRYGRSPKGIETAKRLRLDPDYRARMRAYQAAWMRAKGPGRHRAFRYGLTPDESSAVLAGPCAVCGESATQVHHRGRYVIAGLCQQCNKDEGPLWAEWRAGGIVVLATSRWAALLTGDSSRWPATRAVGYVLDRVNKSFWNHDDSFLADEYEEAS